VGRHIRTVDGWRAVAEDQDERAERLTRVAVQLVARVRDEPADANWRWFLSVLPDPLDREHVAFILAAAVPLDSPWRHLTAWVGQPASVLAPCGTRAAYLRHKAHGQAPDEPCVAAYREYERDRIRRRRAAA